MTAHKKTLIRQAGSAEAFIDSLPLVVNYVKYSANSAAFQDVLTRNHQKASRKVLETMVSREFIGFFRRQDIWAGRQKTVLRRKSQRVSTIRHNQAFAQIIAHSLREKSVLGTVFGFRAKRCGLLSPRPRRVEGTK